MTKVKIDSDGMPFFKESHSVSIPIVMREIKSNSERFKEPKAPNQSQGNGNRTEKPKYVAPTSRVATQKERATEVVGLIIGFQKGHPIVQINGTTNQLKHVHLSNKMKHEKRAHALSTGDLVWIRMDLNSRDSGTLIHKVLTIVPKKAVASQKTKPKKSAKKKVAAASKTVANSSRKKPLIKSKSIKKSPSKKTTGKKVVSKKSLSKAKRSKR